MPKKLSPKRLADMISEATVDAYTEDEQKTGFYTLIDDALATPFETMVLGVTVTVSKIDLTHASEIVAVCQRGKASQRVPVLDLPLPKPPPAGWEWIEAYRCWSRGG